MCSKLALNILIPFPCLICCSAFYFLPYLLLCYLLPLWSALCHTQSGCPCYLWYAWYRLATPDSVFDNFGNKCQIFNYKFQFWACRVRVIIPRNFPLCRYEAFTYSILIPYSLQVLICSFIDNFAGMHISLCTFCWHLKQCGLVSWEHNPEWISFSEQG